MLMGQMSIVAGRTLLENWLKQINMIQNSDEQSSAFYSLHTVIVLNYSALQGFSILFTYAYILSTDMLLKYFNYSLFLHECSMFCWGLTWTTIIMAMVSVV